jgi:hypothetical protein
MVMILTDLAFTLTNAFYWGVAELQHDIGRLVVGATIAQPSAIALDFWQARLSRLTAAPTTQR